MIAPRTSSFARKIPLNEQWREVPDWPGYRVSEGGRVMQTVGKYAPHVLTQSPSTTPKWNRWPYACVRLGRLVDGKQVWRHIRVHRVVMAAFVGSLPEGMEIHHRDGNHWNDALANLEYVTKRLNEDYAQPLRPRGDRHPAAKLTEDQVRAIRADKTWSLRRIAKKYGVANTTILSIRHRQTWKHVA